MLLRIKFALLAGILLGSTALTVDARGGTLRNGEQLRHSWISQKEYARAKSSGLLFVSDFGNHVVDIFAAKNPKLPIGQVQGLLSQPAALAVDKSDNLYVYDERGGYILEFKPPYTGPYVKRFSGFWGPAPSITVDSSGTLYIAASLNQVYEFPHGQTNGKGINLPVAPNGVTLDSSGNLVCTYNAAGAAGVFQLTKASPIPTNLLIPLEASSADIAFDNSGNLVVEDSDGAYINVYPPGSTKPSKTFDDGFTNPNHMVFDSSRQHLYVSDYGNNTVKVIAYPSGTVQSQLTGFVNATGVAVSPAAIP
jgi:sugar lactone lactonase YvrE